MVVAALAWPGAACSLLFSPAETQTTGPGDRSDLQFSFERSDAEALLSSGRLAAQLVLNDEARIRDGALDLLGVSSTGLASARSEFAVREFADACRSSGQFSISLWMTPGDLTARESTPARIVTLEEGDSTATNFTVGQGPHGGNGNTQELFDRITLRATDASPIEAEELGLTLGEPFWVGYSASADAATLHTYSPSFSEIVSFQGQEPPRIIEWEPTYQLLFGTTPGGSRQWRGLIHHVDLFCRALAVDELRAYAELSAPRR